MVDKVIGVNPHAVDNVVTESFFADGSEVVWHIAVLARVSCGSVAVDNLGKYGDTLELPIGRLAHFSETDINRVGKGTHGEMNQQLLSSPVRQGIRVCADPTIGLEHKPRGIIKIGHVWNSPKVCAVGWRWHGGIVLYQEASSVARDRR